MYQTKPAINPPDALIINALRISNITQSGIRKDIQKTVADERRISLDTSVQYNVRESSKTSAYSIYDIVVAVRENSSTRSQEFTETLALLSNNV